MGNCVRDTQNRTERQSTVHHITSQQGIWRGQTWSEHGHERTAPCMNALFLSLNFYCFVDGPMWYSNSEMLSIHTPHCLSFVHSLFFTLLLLRHPNFPNRIEFIVCICVIRVCCVCVRVSVSLYLRKFIHKIIIKETIRKNESRVSLYRVKLQDLQRFDKITMWHWCVSFACELSFNTILHILLLYFSTHVGIVFIFYFIVVVCLLVVYSVTLLSSIYFTLSLALLLLLLPFPYIQWSRKHAIKKEEKREESSITYSTRPLEHQLRFWHATLINLRIIETQRHLLMYFRCAVLRARACACLCLLWVSALFVAKRLLMKVNVHLYCWFMWACVCADARTLLFWHIRFVYLCFLT